MPHSIQGTDQGRELLLLIATGSVSDIAAIAYLDKHKQLVVASTQASVCNLQSQGNEAKASLREWRHPQRTERAPI